MTVLYLEALAGIALSLSILMAIAWMVQWRTGNSGWVDPIWTLLVGSVRLSSHIAVRTAGITDDPRYAAFAREWGADWPRKMLVFLQNQGFGSIPPVFAILVAARPRTSMLFPLPPQKGVVT